MSAAREVTPNELNAAVAAELKKNEKIKAPAWVLIVKASSHNERVPEQEDYWFVKCAALLRTIGLAEAPVGVQRLRHKYGGRTQHTVARSHHRKAGGKTIRLALQQLEAAGFVKKDKTGRVIAPAGMSLLDKTAAKVQGKNAEAKPKENLQSVKPEKKEVEAKAKEQPQETATPETKA